MHWANVVITGAWAYGCIGLLVAAAFLLAGIDRIDPSARGSVASRVLLVPGVVLLWPLVLVRWRRLEHAPL